MSDGITVNTTNENITIGVSSNPVIIDVNVVEANPVSNSITVNTNTQNVTLSVNTVQNDINVQVVEAGALWGSIVGTITNQADLINYIGKLGVTSPYGQAASNTSIFPIYGSNVIAATATNSVIAGGQHNSVSGYYSAIGGGGGNKICDYGYNIIAGGQSNTISCCYNNFIGSGFLNTACGKAVSIVGGVSNTASGDYASILGGCNNNTNNQACSFIIGQGITASLPNYTYVNNLSTPGSICAGTFYGDGSHLIGVCLPGQVGINSLVQNTSGNWNSAYSIATSYSSVSSTFATNTTVNTLTSLLTLTTTTRTLTGLLVKTTDLNTLSATLLTRTDANTLSSLLTPLTLTNTLTSLLVTNIAFSAYQTNVANTTATLLPTSVYRNTSGSFVPNTAINTLTGNWNSAYTSTTALNLSSTYWNSVYTTVQSNSATWSAPASSTQTLSFNPSNDILSISNSNSVSLSTLDYSNTNATNTYLTIQQFVAVPSNVANINKGNTVTLYNGRVYIFAGTNPSDSNQYLQINANPHTPFYVVVPLSATSPVAIDNFYLGDFKSAKYEFQITNNYDNNIYYSEINVLGSIGTSTGVASEYGQIATAPLINGYDVNVSGNQLYFNVYFNTTSGTNTLIFKGLRTNFYVI